MLVSLLISTYNWKEALSLCLYSVFSQTVKPAEILIADDGSRDDTRQLIEEMRAKTDISIVHVWHEDKGFRLSAIRNRSIAQAKGDYIIQIDGDIILDKNFISDHLELAEKGYFVCGSRVLLGRMYTARLLRGLESHPATLKQDYRFMLNGFRSHILRHYLANRYAKHSMLSIRGCNMAFWKNDLMRVNGYNETLEMWGQEDVEISYRLIHAGVQKKQLKMGGVQFHLYHKFASRENLEYHEQVLHRVIENKTVWCENGIVKDK
ncbi:glycosyltransferase family 2 protein [uncultured Bacteroides sp.]|uniref:glycosyltransferase family 2 protein n=3 Tax=uncultured Bacteroides sp. TaxID=162156 RepID=UPI0025DC7470|nr:glycosyltransferase family 2 protein [uncultured Bacteroides sp.]